VASLGAVAVELVEITGANRAAVEAVRLAPSQERFVSDVPDSLAQAVEHAYANPWYRAVYAAGEPIGFVMLSWNATPRPPDVIGPWFLWKLIIDERHQGRGHGADVVRQVAALVAAEGATELLTSYVPGEGGPAGFYARLGFVPTGEVDGDGEVIVRLPLPATSP
jgi:diamine N-acetyltransferase